MDLQKARHTLKKCALSDTPYRIVQDWNLGNHRTPPIVFAWLDLYLLIKNREKIKGNL